METNTRLGAMLALLWIFQGKMLPKVAGFEFVTDVEKVKIKSFKRHFTFFPHEEINCILRFKGSLETLTPANL